MTPQIAKIIGISLIAVLLFLSGIFVGYSYCKRTQDKGVIDQQEKDAETVMKHVDKKDEVRKNVDEKIEAIKKVIDPSGCLDAGSPDDYLNKLLSADRAAKSGFD